VGTNTNRPAARSGPQDRGTAADASPAGAPRRRAPDDSPETPAERRLVNLLLIGIILLIFGAALWLGDALLDARRIDDCIASGRRNCAPITVPSPPPR
jgi:hypothetical protein